MAVYDRDYITTLPLLYDKAFEYSGGDWNKYNNDVGDTMLKLLASASHSVDYYFRNFLNALFLPNDDWSLKSLIWELTGYKPNYIRADYLMVQLYWPECGLKSYVPLYQYTPFKVTADGKEYTFLCAQDYMIPPRTTRINIRLVNGSLETIEQDYTLVKGNSIKLSDNDIDYDLVTVMISGTKWTQVRNVYYSPNTERIFSLHKEEDGTYLYLHPNWRDYVDAYDKTFIVYFVLSKFDFEMYTDDCMTVEFSAELLSLDGEDVSPFYRIIPLLNSDEAVDAANLMPSTTEGNRAITTLDYATNALLFPGIVASGAYDWNTPSVCTTPFEVVLVACDKNMNLSEHMKQVLKAYLESIGSPLINVRIIPPIFMKHNLLVVLDIGDYRGTLAEIQIRTIVTEALENFYKIGNLPPGRVVKTKELNSLIMHADSRVYFATTSFLTTAPHGPLIVPILGEVVIITSATAFTKEDWGDGIDRLYVGPWAKEPYAMVDRALPLGIFVTFEAKSGELAPIDKLPVEVFDSVVSTEKSPLFNIGSDVMPVADFGVGDEYRYILETGGDPTIGPVFIFVYETDGSSVFAKCKREITNTVRAEIKFTNGLGTEYVDPHIVEIPVTMVDTDQIKELIAQAYNDVPGLKIYDVDGNVIRITGEDITYVDPNAPFEDIPVEAEESDEPVTGGAKEDVSRVVPKYAQEGHIDGFEDTITEIPSKKEKSNLGASGVSRQAFISDAVQVRENILGAGTDIDRQITVDDAMDVSERTFVYIPYDNRTFSKERIRATEKLMLQQINFVMTEIEDHSYQTYVGVNYIGRGKYDYNPDAYGTMECNSNVYLSITDTYTEYTPVRPEIYEEKAVYGEPYYIREKDGNELNWYFCQTAVTQEVEATTFIGKGVRVGFKLLRDMGIYVETDVATIRGFIYSAQMQPEDFTILVD